MSNDQYPERRPERPRVEPEIIPPGQDARSMREASGMWMRFEDRGGTHRIFIARSGLPSIILGLLVIGLIAAVVFVVLAGIVLVWVPILIAAIALALLSGAIRHRWWRLKTWWAGGR